MFFALLTMIEPLREVYTHHFVTTMSVCSFSDSIRYSQGNRTQKIIKNYWKYMVSIGLLVIKVHGFSWS